MSWWVDKFISWWVDVFMGSWAYELMYSGVVGFSWVYKAANWFVLHFVYKRSVYLVLAHKDNEILLIYKNTKSQDSFKNKQTLNTNGHRNLNYTHTETKAVHVQALKPISPKVWTCNTNTNSNATKMYGMA